MSTINVPTQFHNNPESLLYDNEGNEIFAQNDALYDLEFEQSITLFTNRDQDIEQELKASAKLNETITWLQDQLEHVKTSMKNAELTNNHGLKGHLEGMRDGLTRCLKMLER